MAELGIDKKTAMVARLGELLREIPKAEGTRLAGRERGSNSGVGGTKTEPPTNIATLAEMGIDRKTSAIAQQLASLSPEMRAAHAVPPAVPKRNRR